MHKKMERGGDVTSVPPANDDARLFGGLRLAAASGAQSRRARDRSVPALDHNLAGVTTLRRDEGEWLPAGKDCSIRILNHDAASGSATFLVRLKPGGVIPYHEHHADEECLVLNGVIEVGGLKLNPGDYQFLQAGSVHDDIRSASGALLLLRAELLLAD
jgi:quercetin dioxygenase-like cupin family protein